MYTVVKNVQIVIALLKKHNIKHIVISPGGTSIPIVQGIQDDPFFTCYSVVDERSAMYFAIGLYLELGVPIATSCTSAQATRNYLPGLTEAFYKHVPILAITTSKHSKYIYQGYMQAPDQTSLPVDAVKRSFALPYVSNHLDALHCERMVNEAILELTHRSPGPVQLNLQMVDSEQRTLVDVELPEVKMIKRYMLWEDWNISLSDEKIMIVIGEHRPFTEKQIEIIDAFVQSHNAFIYTNHLSNYHGECTVSANLFLTCISNDFFIKNYQPDILITIGGQTGDYPLYGKLSKGNKFDFEHWQVCEEGNLMDTYDKLTKIFECPTEIFFEKLTRKKDVPHKYYEQWKQLADSVSIPENLPFSNAYLAQQLHESLPKNSYLHLAILNSLRMWSLFPLDPSITCYSNVAAFGIDGDISVMLGQSVATSKLCFLVIGDLAFFYDMNSLGIRDLKNNIRILLINNDGGVEFKQNRDEFSRKINLDMYTAAIGHNKSGAKGWAVDNGFKYFSARTKEDFLKFKKDFTNQSDQPIVFEVFVSAEDELKAKECIYDYNRDESFTKSTIRSVLGNEGINTIKKILKK